MDDETIEVPVRWVYEVMYALNDATTIGKRSCAPNDHLHYANHDRLVTEARALLDRDDV